MCTGVGAARGLSGCYLPKTNLSASARNLQNIKDIRADQPTKTRETPYRNHVLPLLNSHGLKQLILKNVVCVYIYIYIYVQYFLCIVIERIV